MEVSHVEDLANRSDPESCAPGREGMGEALTGGGTGRVLSREIFVTGNDPLHKVTIIPRGRALGVTMNLPERDRLSWKKNEIEARLAMTFGGRVAEELIFGPENVTTGAASDIKQATKMARAMVTEYGMSDKLGPLLYGDNEEEVFLGHSVAQRKNISEATAQIIDEEVRRFIRVAEERAREVLTEQMDGLHAVAEGLLEYETLSGVEIDAILKGEPIVREDTDSSSEEPPTTTSVPAAGKKADDQDPGGMSPEPQPGG